MNLRAKGIAVLVLGLNVWAHASAAPITLAEALGQAEAASPDLKAAQHRAQAAQESITVAKAAFLPTADLQAIDSIGMPASNGSLGITGLMGSPYRSGLGAGVVANLGILDFGRHYSLLAAQQSLIAAQAQVQTVRFQVDLAVLEIYLDAANLLGQETAASNIAQEIAALQREVNRFVRTGQHSVVERLLVQDQIMQAQMETAAYQKQSALALQRLALNLGTPQALVVPSPLDIAEPLESSRTFSGANPQIAELAAQAEAAQAQAKAVDALQMPRVTATASAGDDDRTRLVDKRYYAAGVGIDVPLFYGFRLRGLSRQAKATADAREEDALALTLQVNELNAHYEETIGGDRVRLEYLTQELEGARKALKLAKDRYLSYSGALVDVREAVRNLERVESQQISVRTDLLRAVGSKALLNGQSLS